MQKIQTVTSAANPLVREVRKAIARGGLTSDGLAVAEGYHLFEEAVRSGLEIRTVLVAESVRKLPETARIIRVPDALFQTLAATETTQGVIALVRPPEWNIEQLFHAPALVVALDGVQDPGNAGTIVRGAEAFGASGIIFLKGTVNPWNPKTLRAAAGSLFRLPMLHSMAPNAAVTAFRDRGLETYAAMPASQAKALVSATDLRRPCVLIIGSEGRGVSAEMRAASRGIAIPTVGVESLNAAVAAAILLYEAQRQRLAS